MARGGGEYDTHHRHSDPFSRKLEHGSVLACREAGKHQKGFQIGRAEKEVQEELKAVQDSKDRLRTQEIGLLREIMEIQAVAWVVGIGTNNFTVSDVCPVLDGEDEDNNVFGNVFADLEDDSDSLRISCEDEEMIVKIGRAETMDKHSLFVVAVRTKEQAQQVFACLTDLEETLDSVKEHEAIRTKVQALNVVVEPTDLEG